ncbi:hypothetical protein SAMN04515671_1096 [Nakamurella panacisegetis]|uniref:Uncharacterized protein n=1 Tax=Nakamurella panacisegetis TaxID=1090615 RepID=A0A1H0JY67_9ACTN|nr:hypothetical protein [Nakamurella panacisegetis]SDO48748.1 hypothetical protein SAMN04515671_1096 [Nakamurella panacisegetis]
MRFIQMQHDSIGTVLINPAQVASITEKAGETGCTVRLSDGSVYTSHGSAAEFADLVVTASSTPAHPRPMASP